MEVQKVGIIKTLLKTLLPLYVEVGYDYTHINYTSKTFP